MAGLPRASRHLKANFDARLARVADALSMKRLWRDSSDHEWPRVDLQRDSLVRVKPLTAATLQDPELQGAYFRRYMELIDAGDRVQRRHRARKADLRLVGMRNRLDISSAGLPTF